MLERGADREIECLQSHCTGLATGWNRKSKQLEFTLQNWNDGRPLLPLINEWRIDKEMEPFYNSENDNVSTVEAGSTESVSVPLPKRPRPVSPSRSFETEGRIGFFETTAIFLSIKDFGSMYPRLKIPATLERGCGHERPTCTCQRNNMPVSSMVLFGEGRLLTVYLDAGLFFYVPTWYSKCLVHSWSRRSNQVDCFLFICSAGVSLAWGRISCRRFLSSMLRDF
jgi:hypothetical protein